MSAGSSTRLPFDAIDPTLCALYRKATPAEKLAVVTRINSSLQALKTASLRAEDPTRDRAEERRLIRLWWLGARD